MLRRTHFVIFKSNARYSITECSNSGLKQAFLTQGDVSGDPSVLARLSHTKPENVSIESYIEKNAGHLIFES
jgi:hypothetical protein